MKFSYLKRITSTAVAAIALFSGISSAHAYDWENKNYRSLMFGLASGATWAARTDGSPFGAAHNIIEAWKTVPKNETFWYGPVLRKTCGDAAQDGLTYVDPFQTFPEDEIDFYFRAVLLKHGITAYNTINLCNWGTGSPMDVARKVNSLRAEAGRLRDLGRKALVNDAAFKDAYDKHKKLYFLLYEQRIAVKETFDALSAPINPAFSEYDRQVETIRRVAAHLKAVSGSEHLFQGGGRYLVEGINRLDPGYLPGAILTGTEP